MSTAATAEKEISGLTLADVAKKSEMAGLGWSINQADDKTWAAHEKAGDLRTIGPAKNMSALHTQVKIASGDSTDGKKVKVGSSKLESGKYENKQPILTGTEDAVFEDLKTAGREYRLTTMEVLRLQTIQRSQKDTCEKLMDKFRDQLNRATDDEGHEELFFTVDVNGESVDILLAKEEKEVLKTRKHSE